MLMRGLLGSSDEPSSHYSDEASIDCEVLLIGEDDGSVGDSNASQIGCILINQQRHSCGDADQVSVNGREVCSPGAFVTPSEDIVEGVSEDGCTIADHDD
jgi:hypothetical protein